MDAVFGNPKLLLLVWLVPAIGAWWVFNKRRRERGLEAFVSPAMQKKLRPPAAKRRAQWQIALFLAGLFFCLLAAARPQWGTRQETVFQRGRDLIICLDVSRSMLAEDVHPNRLERAKADLIDLIRELRGDRAGLITFRRKANLICPLTTDYAYLQQALDAAGTHSAPPGETDIGDAIYKALDAFEDEEGSHKAIILVSDGEDLQGRAIEAAEIAAEKQIAIFTVGLGSRRGATIPDADARGGRKAYLGSNVVSRLDDRTLYDIAQTTGAHYIPMGTASTANTTLGTLYMDHLRNISAQDLEETQMRRHIDRFQWFLLPGLLFFLAGTCLSRGRLAYRNETHGQPDPPKPATPPRIPSASPQKLKDLNPPQTAMKQLVVILSLGILSSFSAQAQTNTIGPATTNEVATALDIPPGRTGGRIAQRLFRDGKYEQAAAAYLEAAKGSARRSQEDFRYNAAVALYREGKFEESSRLLKELVVSGAKNRPTITAGLGAALFKSSQSLEDSDAQALRTKADLAGDAAEAFREAARVAPDEAQALENLSIAVTRAGAVEEQAQIAELLAQYENADAGKIMSEMLKKQRDVSKGMQAAVTNDSPSKIQEFERLSEEQRANADLWIPLKQKLLATMSQQPADTNMQQQLANLDQMIEVTRDNMKEASRSLRDLEPRSQDVIALSEAAIYSLWKGIAPFPALLQEDIRLQTNLIDLATVIPSAQAGALEHLSAGQKEAGSLTGLFKARFEAAMASQAAAPGTITPQPDDPSLLHTNALGAAADGQIDEETREKILSLADEALRAQSSAADALHLAHMGEAKAAQRHAYHLLKQIEKLLPKQNQQQEQQQDEDQQEQEPSQENEQPQMQQPQEPENQEPEPQDNQQPEDQQEDLTPDDVKKILERALQREKEHEAELKRRLQESVPMSPSARDW